MLFPSGIIYVNTTYKMAKNNKGFNRDHIYPNTDPWYRTLKSVLTISRKIARLRGFKYFILSIITAQRLLYTIN